MKDLEFPALINKELRVVMIGKRSSHYDTTIRLCCIDSVQLSDLRNFKSYLDFFKALLK